MKKNKLVIAHRGASALARFENTLESFQIAINLKVDMAEFDIRRTKDKQLIVFHDKELENVSIRKMTYEKINKVAGKKGYFVPTLKDVLELCQGKIKLDIELKESGYEEEILNMIKPLYSYDQYLIKSFKDEVVLKLKQLDSNLTVGLLIGRSKGDFALRLSEYFPNKRLTACKADFIGPNYRFLTPGFILRMKILKKPIYLWTINNPKAIAFYLHTPIDGIITDRPDLAMKMKQS